MEIPTVGCNGVFNEGSNRALVMWQGLRGLGERGRLAREKRQEGSVSQDKEFKLHPTSPMGRPRSLIKGMLRTNLCFGKIAT